MKNSKKNIYQKQSHEYSLRFYIIGSLIFFILAVFIFSWKQRLFYVDEAFNLSAFGLFGDFCGGVLGTIFALLSVLLLINTFISQRNLTETQRFNDLFFELLRLYQEQTKELQIQGVIIKKDQSEEQYEANNKDFFDINKNIIRRKFTPGTSYKRSMQNAIFVYSPFYLRYKSKLAIYYRTLYRIFDLIESSPFLNSKTKKEYAKIVRAQLTEGELFFLRYNAFSYYGQKFIVFLNKYNVLKHLTHFELLEFKSWWGGLTREESSGVDYIFLLIKDFMKNHNDEINISWTLPLDSLRYKIIIIKRLDNISISFNINKNKKNTSIYYDAFSKYDVHRIQALFDCFLKELICYSNFEKFNLFKDLEFYSKPILENNFHINIFSGVKNVKNRKIVFKYELVK